MRKLFVWMIVFAVVLSCLFVPASATETGVTKPGARLMPMDFIFTDSIRVASDEFPPGYANFDVKISGKYDIQGENVISIDVKQCWYRGGINCTEQEMTVVAYPSSGTNGYIMWRLEGSITFSWESPVSGMQYETVYYQSPLYTFYGGNYVV